MIFTFVLFFEYPAKDNYCKQIKFCAFIANIANEPPLIQVNA